MLRNKLRKIGNNIIKYKYFQRRNKLKLGLALSGGGIRGVAHIGVLKALEENNIKIDIIGGTSSGGLIASLYAMGYKPCYMYQLFKRYSKEMVYMDSKPILSGVKSYLFNKEINISGINDGSKLENLYNNLARKKNVYFMKDIKMPIAIPSTDLTDSKECVFSNFIPIEKSEKKYITDIPVGTAVRASSSFPAFFCPCEYKNHIFLDGGAVDNIPAREVKKLGADKVISVNFEEGKIDNNSNVMDILMKTLDIMGNNISKDVIENSDYVLTISTEKVGLLEDTKVDSCFKYGYDITLKNIDKIRAVIN